ncbi:MAG: hypothetical protein EOP09_14890, partial [Proteobacteria bacterium]
MKYSFLSLNAAAKAFGKPVEEIATMLESIVSHDEVEKLIRAWLRSVRYESDGSYLYRPLRAVYPTFFVYEESTDYGDTCKVLTADYSVSDEGKLIVGEPVEVRVEIKYVAVAQGTESNKQLRNITIGSMREAKIDENGMV